MTDRFAILGWGSLLWDDRHPKFNAQIGVWLYDGPVVPIELSRISSTRDDALTLVIDSEHGSQITSAWCLGRRADFEQAIEDLKVREGTGRRKIGYVHGGDRQSRDAKIANAVQAWATEHKLDGVVWTDLESNFKEKTGRPFSIDAAREHLNSLTDSGKTQARDYIRHAPAFVKTALRASLVDFIAKDPSQ
jgi:hypothetical protein